MDNRHARMKALLAALGGASVVRARLGLTQASIKAALYGRVFPSVWFGPMAALAAEIKPPVQIETDLFGPSQTETWPPVSLVPAHGGEAA